MLLLLKDVWKRMEYFFKLETEQPKMNKILVYMTEMKFPKIWLTSHPD